MQSSSEIHASPKQSSYRPEIDGIRAFAVTAVIINHFNKDILPSGYLGVDIFFVISGFVITSSLSSRPCKNFSDFLAGFYTRRIKRLVPALVLFVIIVSVLISLFDPNPKFSLETGIASLFGLSNLYLLKYSTDYFAPSTELNVFTHTWSLGVEEQFYFLFPFLVWFTGFSRLTSKGSRNLFWLMGVLSVASLIAFCYSYRTNQPAAYFLMPTRLWELGAGCLLFLGLKHFKESFLILEKVPPLIVIGAIISILFVPSGLALVTTFAVVVFTTVLISCLRSGTTAYKLLTHPQVVYIGLISYSLYLWHWGVLSLSRWTVGIHWWSVPFQIALMLLLSIASYRYIETPLRRSDWSVYRWQSIGYGMSASLCSALVLLLINSFNGFFLLQGIQDIPSPPAFLPLESSDLPYSPTCVVDGKQRLLKASTFKQCTIPPKVAGGQMIWALGDSHIGHLQGLFKVVHDKTGLGVHLIETPGIPFPMLKENWFKERQMIYEEMRKLFRPGDIVVVSRLFVEREKGNRPIGDLSEWSNEVFKLSDYLSSRGVNLVIVGPPPIFQTESIELCRSTLWNYLRLRPDCSIRRSKILSQINQVYDLLDSISSSRNNIYIFNQFNLLCPPTSEDRCSVVKDGVLAYRDKDHLNSYGSASLSTSFIDFLRHFKLLNKYYSGS